MAAKTKAQPAKAHPEKDEKKIVDFWLNEIRQAREREKHYRKHGKDVIDIYEADDEDAVPFNILYSNTETLRPALFSAQPRPVVMRRFKDEDPIGKLASDAGRRMLEHLLDTNREGYETVSEAMGACTLDALLPGRGVVSLKYDADFVPFAEPRPPDEDDKTPVKPEPIDSEQAEYAKNELICPESIVWNKVYFGFARKWHQVPWMAYEFHLTKEEVAARIDKKIATKLIYTSTQKTDGSDETPRKEEEHVGARRTAVIYQIWDKVGGKTIKYVSPNYKDGLLKEEEDPLGLTGFFNTPRPLMFIEKASSLVPTSPYIMYKNQAKELNRLTKRIQKITEAIKARGAYDGALSGDLQKIFNGEDNELVPAEVASSLATEKGFQNAIWMIPVDILIVVLRELLQAREACKQVIYEITGISDILRGATQASETATAQKIKNQWGTLRLKRMQGEVARYIRDLLRMMLELAASKFSEETWAAMTGLPYLLTAQHEQLTAQFQAMQQIMAQSPPEHPVHKQAEQVQAELQKPVWGQVLQLLKDDKLRSYRIDIETNSTVEPEATEDKQNISELLGMLGQYLQGVGPLVANGTMPFEAAQAMMLAIARRFQFGQEIEDSLKAMQPPKQEDDGQAAEMQKKMAEMDAQMQQKELAFQKKQAEMDIQTKAMQAEQAQQQRELDLDMREAELKIKEHQLGIKEQVSQSMLEMQKQRAGEELELKNKRAEMDRRATAFQEKTKISEQAAEARQGTKIMEQVKGVAQSLEAVQQRAAELEEQLQHVLKVASAKRIKRPIRGADGRIERVEEELEAVA